MKFLAINFGGLGDEVLFLPTLKSVKRAHPDWEITLLTEPRSKAIMQLSSLIDKNIVFDIKKTPLQPADYFELLGLLHSGKYDIVLSSGSSSKVAMLLFLSGIPKRIGYYSGALSRLLLTSAVPLNKEQYAGDMYHDLVKGLKIDLPSAAPEVDLDQEALAKMSAFIKTEEQRSPAAQPGKLVLIHPGMSQMALKKGIIKTWSAENWAALSKRLLALNHKVMLCGGPDDEVTIADITKRLGEKPDEQEGLFINAYGKTGSIKDLAALMHLADLIVCVDSAPMHIAAALKKNLVALFGPTDPKKLLLEGKTAIAISESACLAAARAAGESGASGAGAAAGSTKPAEVEPSVQIPLDTVYQTVLDQLNQASARESSLESPRR